MSDAHNSYRKGDFCMLKKNIYVIAAAVALNTACATQMNMSDEQIVQKRAQGRLDALLSKDFEKAYSYASPAYRKSVSLNRHKAKVLGAAMWTKGEVLSVLCEVEYCDVTTKIHYRSPQVRTELPTEMKNRWIKIDGKWWIYHK